ncbi:5-oxo-L-prolinase OS=Stutzerimonas stutzeri OX=316 GN=CXK95_16090 PE=4 SV=1 [Stutzerimonas stutzeri]
MAAFAPFLDALKEKTARRVARDGFRALLPPAGAGDEGVSRR